MPQGPPIPDVIEPIKKPSPPSNTLSFITAALNVIALATPAVFVREMNSHNSLPSIPRAQIPSDVTTATNDLLERLRSPSNRFNLRADKVNETLLNDVARNPELFSSVKDQLSDSPKLLERHKVISQVFEKLKAGDFLPIRLLGKAPLLHVQSDEGTVVLDPTKMSWFWEHNEEKWDSLVKDFFVEELSKELDEHLDLKSPIVTNQRIAYLAKFALLGVEAKGRLYEKITDPCVDDQTKEQLLALMESAQAAALNIRAGHCNWFNEHGAPIAVTTVHHNNAIYTISVDGNRSGIFSAGLFDIISLSNNSEINDFSNGTDIPAASKEELESLASEILAFSSDVEPKYIIRMLIKYEKGLFPGITDEAYKRSSPESIEREITQQAKDRLRAPRFNGFKSAKERFREKRSVQKMERLKMLLRQRKK